ncbi:MAG: sulfite exporter TauE/SafE family protein [Burkholderiales bacterium]|nr:sulfite exporter TauE/SafE family protein [Burkholderiales bacterium]
MTRSILDEAHIHPAIRDKVASHHADIVREVQAAVAAHDVVVVGMAQNPFPRKARRLLDRVIFVLLVILACVLLAEAWGGNPDGGAPLIAGGALRWTAGLAAGLVIGVVAALLGVAGGELLVPTLVLLYGLDVKLAGSLSLAISLPTLIVGFTRYRESAAFAALKRERGLLAWMASGSIVGTAIGGFLLGVVPASWLLAALGVILLVSAIKVFQHAGRGSAAHGP